MGTQSSVSNHDTKILSILREQRIKGLFTDVKIVSANAVFWAHACVLAPFSFLVSKIFYSKNSLGDGEKWSAQSPCILKFPSSNGDPIETDTCHSRFCEECIQKVIDFIYSGQIKVDENHAEHVRFVADFLEIENLPLRCESTFKKKTSLEDEISGTFQPNSSHETKKSDLFKSIPNSFSPPLKKEIKRKPESKGSVRINFTNILSENRSSLEGTVSSRILSSKPKDGSNDYQKDPYSFKEESSNGANDLVLLKDSTNDHESSKIRERIAGVRIEEPENPAGNKGKMNKKRKPNKPNPSDLLCLFCPFESSTVSELINHKLNTSHEEDTICFLCQNDYPSNQELQSHLKDHLKSDFDSCASDQNGKDGKVYKCDQCDKEFRWRQNFQRHLSSHNAPHKKCASCDFVANTDYALKYHVKKMHSDLFFSCYHENCAFKTKRKGNLKDHILTVHKKTRLCCLNCSKTFSQKKNLQRHLNLYHNTSTTIHHCSLCTYVTHRADNLQKHKTTMHSKVNPNVPSETHTQGIKDYKILGEKCKNNSSNPVNVNIISLKNNESEQNSPFTQTPLDVDNFCLRDIRTTNITDEMNSDVATPMVNVTCSDFSIKNPTLSARNGGQQITGLSCNGFSQSSTNFSVLNGENNGQTVDEQVSRMISIPHIDCKMTGTLSFNETAGTLTYHNLNSESTGALILNEITGELTYIKLHPQQLPLNHESNYQNFPCIDYSNLHCEVNYSQLTNNGVNTLILNESTGELDSVNQTKDRETFEPTERPLARSEDDCPLLFDLVDEEEEENDLLDIDPADLMNECNSNPEIPVLNEWTGEINLLPNNFIGGPFLDEQTGQLSVFDLFDSDLIFDCLDEPAPSNTILNENTGEILRNSTSEETYPSNIGNDFCTNETLAENNGDCHVFCDLGFDNDLKYSLNEATGQLSIEWPDVSEDSNFSFLLNELTGELSVKEING